LNKTGAAQTMAIERIEVSKRSSAAVLRWDTVEATVQVEK